MKTLKSLLATLLVLAVSTSLTAQSTSKLKAELKKMEKAAAQEIEPLIEAAKWAKEKRLINDYKRVLAKVLKLDPDNEKAYALKGWVKFDGKWMSKRKADLLKRKALDAAMKAKGYQKVDGIWVSKDQAADAKKGIFHHEGEIVSRDEKKAYSSGKVRHPVTGTFIDQDDLAKANDGQFRVGGSSWGSEAEADKAHNDLENPWLFRTTHTTLISTLPISKIKEISATFDEGIESVQALFSMKQPSPGHRPLVMIAADQDQFITLGTQIGGEGSAYDIFIAERELSGIGGFEAARPTIMNNHKSWLLYFTKNAAATAYVSGLALDAEAELPLWFVRGVGALASHFQTPGIAAWFGKQHLAKPNPAQDLKAWFSGYQISGEVPRATIDFNIYQAGLVLEFAMRGGNADASKAIQAVTAAFAARDGKAISKTIGALEKTIVKNEEAVRAYLNKITQS